MTEQQKKTETPKPKPQAETPAAARPKQRILVVATDGENVTIAQNEVTLLELEAILARLGTFVAEARQRAMKVALSPPKAAG